MQVNGRKFEKAGELIRELSYMNVELADLESVLEHDGLPQAQVQACKQKIAAKAGAITALKKELASVFHDILTQSEVEADFKEGRGDLIPNYNTLSTLMDRIAIENVKSYHFSQDLGREGLPLAQKEGLERKIALQQRILEALIRELVAFFKSAISQGRYDFLREERTFV